MEFSSIIHRAKSEYSYAYNLDTLHIRLRTAKGDVTRCELLAVDPFNWSPRNDGTPIYDFDKESVEHIKMVKEQESEYHDCWFAEIKDIRWRRTKYCFILENCSEKYIVGCHDIVPYDGKDEKVYELSNYFNYPYINEEDLYSVPEWVKDVVWYQIFPDRFCNGTPDDGRETLAWGSESQDGVGKKFGGNLEGIIKKLDYIKEIGFTGIYMTPVFESPSSHKYDTTNYLNIDPEFGNNETMGRLVEEAHKRGIKVMLDAVFNHCGYFHPFWQDVLKNGTKSKYYDCFYILDPEKKVFEGEIKDGFPMEIPKENLNYRTFAFTSAMPKWNTGNPIVRQHLMSVARFWIEKYHIDGWRLDVSNEISHDFWREFRKVVKEVDPNVYILGENWDNSNPWLMGDQFDGVMNYEFSMPVWKYFNVEKNRLDRYSEQEFRCAIGNLLTSYPKHVTQNLFNLLDSHDTERILNRTGGDKNIAKLAYVFLFTFPGTPSIYYGSEIGMAGGEHSNRQCMVWEEEKQDKDLKKFINKCIKLRKKYECFRTTEFQWLKTVEEENILAYKKEGVEEILYVFLNKGDEKCCSLPDELRGRICVDCDNGAEVRMGDEVVVGANAYKLFIINADDKHITV